MAEKRSGGGFFWGVVGFLTGVAVTLALLAFMSRETGGVADPRTAADEAAESAQEIVPETPVPPAPKAREESRSNIPRGPEPGLDPASDDQIADDAASSGMTSRAPPPEE